MRLSRRRGNHAWVRNAGEKTHIERGPSRDAQPDQLSPASGRDIDDPPCSLGVEHNAPGHLRLYGHVAVDAERRTAFVRAHAVGEFVGARYQHNPAHRTIVERRTEFARAESVLRAGLQRWRGRQGRQRRRRGQRRWRWRRWRRARRGRRRGRRGWRGWRGRRRGKLVDGHGEFFPRGSKAEYTPRGEALWRRGRVARSEESPDIAVPVPIVVAGRGRVGRFGIKMPSRDPNTAIITVAVWVPVEPVGSAVRFVVRSPGGGGALHGPRLSETVMSHTGGGGGGGGEGGEGGEGGGAGGEGGEGGEGGVSGGEGGAGSSR
eukprot:scaffold13190_cov60-Phaeocystis_antarctica.AAC.2